jgi:hypothetical protein
MCALPGSDFVGTPRIRMPSIGLLRARTQRDRGSFWLFAVEGVEVVGASLPG